MKAQPWDPSFIPLSSRFTSLGLSKLYNGVKPSLTGKGHLGSDSILPLTPWVTLGTSCLPSGPGWGAKIGNVGWDPLQLAFFLGYDGHGCFHWDSEARRPGLEPRQSLGTLVSVE